VELAEAGGDVGVFMGEVGGFAGVVFEVDEEILEAGDNRGPVRGWNRQIARAGKSPVPGLSILKDAR
jgi:hypothetical protein